MNDQHRLSFQLEIVTPEKSILTDQVNLVSVPAKTGRLGILARHTPLFAQLTEGEVKISKNNQNMFLSIGAGYVEVTKEKVLVLVSRAFHADALNKQEIIHAKEQAEAALRQKPTGQALTIAHIALRQSLVDLQILRRRRKKST